MVNPDAPKISVDVDFESNHSFFFALFVLLCAVGWAIRDHRRRSLEAMVAQQEERLYTGILSILFVVSILGAFFAFRRQVAEREDNMSDLPRLQRRIEEAITNKLLESDLEEAELERDPVTVVVSMTALMTIFSVTLFIFWYKSRGTNEEVIVRREHRRDSISGPTVYTVRGDRRDYHESPGQFYGDLADTFHYQGPYQIEFNGQAHNTC